MSAISFHTPTDEVMVQGAERAHMAVLTEHVGREPLVDALGWNPRLASAHLNPDNMRVRRGPYGDQLFEDWLRTSLGYPSMESTPLLIHDGEPVSHSDVIANTALLIGSDVLRLLVRLDSQCEIHCFVEGPERAWMADLIEQACDTNMLRRGFSVRGPNKTGGWDAVMELLRAADDDPVVCSYSVCDGFPNAYATTWEPPEGDEDRDGWYELPAEQKWAMGIDYLRTSPAMLRLTPVGWRSYRFGACLTAFDFAAKHRTPDDLAPVEATHTAVETTHTERPDE